MAATKKDLENQLADVLDELKEARAEHKLALDALNRQLRDLETKTTENFGRLWLRGGGSVISICVLVISAVAWMVDGVNDEIAEMRIRMDFLQKEVSVASATINVVSENVTGLSDWKRDTEDRLRETKIAIDSIAQKLGVRVSQGGPETDGPPSPKPKRKSR